MSLNHYIKNVLEKYKQEKSIYDRLVTYFEKNLAARTYAEICEGKGWDYVIDHLTVRAYNIDKAAEHFINLGYKYGEMVDYKNEGWYAKVYRHPNFPVMFIDQTYDDAPKSLQIIKQWVDKFGDKDYHHIAVLLPKDVEIEETIDLLKQKGINFPGKVTGLKGTRLRQIFTQAEVVDGVPYSVLELAQRNPDPKTGKIYTGFISEQADSLMKDSTL